MVQRWRWVTLLALLVLVWTGCSGESAENKGKNSTPSAGRPAAGAGGKGGKGGSAGKGSTTGGTGGTNAQGGDAGDPGQGATSGSSAGGVGGSVSGAGGTVGGSAGFAGTLTGGTGGVAGSSTLPPFNWSCGSSLYGDGVCHCGCGASDIDCKHDAIDDCEVCDAPNSCSGAECPGRISEADPTRCEPLPAGWVCQGRLYADGESCECGCGAPDPDCADSTLESCDVCDVPSGCSNSDCPGSIDEDDNSRCFIPPGWTCLASLYGDGYCDCGCGVLDERDCEDETPASCDYCPPSSCTPFDCDGTLLETNNAICINPPDTWNCSDRLYNDGDQCDCGCGYFDPDCESNDISACDKCNLEGSCSGLACPGIIDEKAIAYCVHPEPPPEWTCYAYAYGDGYTCDCGCGVRDADCRLTTVDACDRCPGCNIYGNCTDIVDPEDTTQCVPAPEGWTCDEDKYADNICDCGCGVLDVDCFGWMQSNYCGRCPEEGCSNGKCERLEPDDNTKCNFTVPAEWTCDANLYSDGACDCGCGVQDLDCLSLERDECDACPAGSCACEAGCTGSTCRTLVKPDDNTTCL